jgi:hypothetical protein
MYPSGTAIPAVRYEGDGSMPLIDRSNNEVRVETLVTREDGRDSRGGKLYEISPPSENDPDGAVFVIWSGDSYGTWEKPKVIGAAFKSV